jgi:hypothetical protein
MLDIETLDIPENSGISAVVTDICLWPFTNLGEFVPDVDPIRFILPAKPQIKDLGRSMGFDTMMFWFDQPAEARAPWFKDIQVGSLVDLHMNVHMLADQIRLHTPTEIWARGPQFDVAILEDLMRQLQIDIPWKYNQIRDLRTLMAMAGLDVKDVHPQPGFVKHSAFSDCVFQVKCYKEAVKILFNEED